MNNFQKLEDCLAKVRVAAGAAETHGTLCGALCVLGELGEKEWLALAVESEGELSAEARQQLLSLQEQMQAELQDEAIGFAPLLPEDDAALDVRANAIGDWCRGFLYGLSHGGIQDVSKLPGDAAEVVEDFLAISQIGTEGMEDESAEAQLLEITEYVRVGVLLVNEELRAMRVQPDGKVH